MNQVARVFVVINILLSAAFLMAAATFLHQSTDWKQQKADADAAAMKSDAELRGQNSKLDAEIARLNDDLISRKSKLTSLEGNLDTVKSQLENANEQKNQTERKHQALIQTHNQATAKLAAISDSVSGLQDMIENYRKRAEAAQDSEAEALKGQKELAGVRQQLTQENGRLSNQIKELESKLNASNTELADYRNNYPPPTNKSQPMVEGQVIRFDAGTNMVQVNKGANDGIRLGHRFDILNGSNYVCTVMIDYIDASTSVGHISIPSTNGAVPTSGNKATKLTGM